MKKVIHIIISIVYIVLGIGAPLAAINAILALDIGALLTAATGLIMLLAGIFGLFRIKPLKRRIFGIIIFVLALASVITAFAGGNFLPIGAIVQAILAWLYIIW